MMNIMDDSGRKPKACSSWQPPPQRKANHKDHKDHEGHEGRKTRAGIRECQKTSFSWPFFVLFVIFVVFVFAVFLSWTNSPPPAVGEPAPLINPAPAAADLAAGSAAARADDVRADPHEGAHGPAEPSVKTRQVDLPVH
jgi:hypothetical protein